MIPSSRPYLDSKETDAVARVLKSGWLGSGPKTQQFEAALKEMIGAKNVLAVNTGTSALHLALLGFSIDPRDEVIVPSLTFCATIQAIIAVGAIPVFVEIDPNTLCIDVTDIRKNISKNSKAILPVHYGGQPCEMDEIMAISDEFNLIVVEDAAHAFGSFYKGKPIGTIGHVTCFSFDPIKNITCGEGGAVALEDDTVAEKIRKMRVLGMDKDGYLRYKIAGLGYEVISEGYRYHMSDINAAIGLEQLLKFKEIAKRRKVIWELYSNSLKDVKNILVLQHDIKQIVPFNFVVRILNGLRDELYTYLRKKEIGVGIHYPLNHLQPFFKGKLKSLPVTENVGKQILTLPLFPSMSDSDVYNIIQEVKKGLKVVGGGC